MGRVVTGDNPCYIMLRANNLRSRLGFDLWRRSPVKLVTVNPQVSYTKQQYTLPQRVADSTLRWYLNPNYTALQREEKEN